MATAESKTRTEIEKALEEATASLSRIQNFEASILIQKDRLGQWSFEDAVGPAQRIVDLFKQLPISTLGLLPIQELLLVKSLTDGAYNLFTQILEFDTEKGDNSNRRSQTLDRLASNYQSQFTQFFPLISYSIARTVDFNRLEQQGLAAVQSIKDRTENLMAEISVQKEEAARILDEVRKTAAERGISQEAFYFKGEADTHALAAEKWREWTVNMAMAVGAYGVLALFIHKIPWLSPENNFDMIQLIAGKLIIFVVLFYMLSICARSFLANRHNEIVNRHRQNALLTYKSLVDAGGTPEARDIILNHAAASVYHLHDTGFTKPVDAGGSSSSSIIGLLPKGSLPTGAN